MNKNKKVFFEEWGLIDYKEAWNRQENIFASTVKLKTEIRNRGEDDASFTGIKTVTPNYLIFCEHRHVYTLGKSGKPEHLLLNEAELAAKNAVFYPINRGGDITYHGPGQLVVYPILDLDNFFTDIHLYLRTLEEAVILTLADFGIKGERYPGYTGVWIDAGDPQKARKICAMGVRCSRWVTMHGLAFNISPNLAYFDNIIPCGIEDKAVTSMEAELAQKVSVKEVSDVLKKHLYQLFGMMETQGNMISKAELIEVYFKKTAINDFDRYPFNLPFFKTADKIEFHPEVTFIVGENGTGKSSLVEAIAVLCGFNPEGGTRNFNFNTRESHSKLYQYMQASRGVSRRKDGFFFRSESFYNVATEIDNIGSGILKSYGNKSLHEQSHGESFWAVFFNRFGGNGLYILDEPEAALSPTRQMAMLLRINELVKQNSQFIIATHSPILIAYPNATIYELSEQGIEVKKYRETELFKVYKDFLTNTDQVLDFLINGEDE